MKTTLLKFSFLLAGLLTAASSYAEDAEIKMTTSAAAGTELRIYSLPYNSATITGADKGEYFGTYLSKGPGTEITITGDIEQLEVYGCSLTDINVVKAPELSILKCYKNSLTALNLDNCSALEILDCKENSIASLDLSKCSKLSEVNVSKNEITSLKLDVLGELKKLYCGDNKLAALDVTGCPVLADLQAENNQLTSLNLSGNSALWWVHIFGNRFEGANVEDFTSKIQVSAQTPGMLYLVDTKNDNEGNKFYVKDIQALQAKGWSTCDYLGGTDSGYMTGTFYNGIDYVPTVSAQTITFTTTRAVGSTVKLSISADSDIAIEGVAETDYTGSNKTFTLTSQTVTIKGDVTDFECPGNDITSLTITPNSKLSSLDCQNNQIESLEVVGAASMTQLHCQKNKISHLDITDCVGLFRVDCYQNALAGDEMTAFVNSLCDGTKNNPYLFIIDTKAAAGSESNVATKAQVAVAKGKGWSIFDYSNGDRWGMGVAYEGSDDPSTPTLPEQFFTITKPTKDYVMMTVKFVDSSYTPTVEGGEVTGWNGESLTVKFSEGETVKVYGDAKVIQVLYSQLSAIDVTNLPNLEELNVALNDLTSLDVSKNSKLETLSCEMNLLTSLDLSGCPALDFLNCYGNQIKDAEMTAMVSSLPTRSFSRFGQFIVIDSDYASEGNVCLTSDVNIASNKLWFTYDLHSSGEKQIYEGSAGVDGISVDKAGLQFDSASQTVTAAEGESIEIYSAAGALVVKSAANAVNVSELAHGLYIAKTSKQALRFVK